MLPRPASPLVTGAGVRTAGGLSRAADGVAPDALRPEPVHLRRRRRAVVEVRQSEAGDRPPRRWTLPLGRAGVGRRRAFCASPGLSSPRPDSGYGRVLSLTVR